MRTTRRARRSPIRAALAFLALAALAAPVSAGASTIAVFGDANMFPAFPPAGNTVVLDHLLGAGTSVLVSRQTAGFTPSLGIEAHYGSLPGITVSASSSPITAALLAGVDLLVLDLEFAQPNPYDGAETSAVAAFFAAGGDVAFIAEHNSVADYNLFLAALGTAIRFTGEPRCCAPGHDADTVRPTILTTGVAAFQIGAASPLTGGTPAVQDQGFTVFVFEQIPEPGLPALLVVALGILPALGRRRR